MVLLLPRLTIHFLVSKLSLEKNEDQVRISFSYYRCPPLDGYQLTYYLEENNEKDRIGLTMFVVVV